MERVDALLAERREGRFDPGLVSNALHDHLAADCAHRSFQFLSLVGGVWIARIARKADKLRRGDSSKKHFQFFRAQRNDEEGHSSHVAAGAA